jgi:hypothetical protein
MRGLVDLTAATVGIDFWKSARTPSELGIANLSRSELLDYLHAGRP